MCESTCSAHILLKSTIHPSKHKFTAMAVGDVLNEIVSSNEVSVSSLLKAKPFTASIKDDTILSVAR